MILVIKSVIAFCKYISNKSTAHLEAQRKSELLGDSIKYKWLIPNLFTLFSD